MTPTPARIRAGLHGAEQRRPLYSRFPPLYVVAHPWLKAAARRVFAVRQGRTDALVHAYLERFDDLPAADGAPVPLLLTHDIDTAAGYATLPRLLEVEESLGLASLSLVVTHRYRWDPARLRAWRERGHRFGIHDTTHDNQLAFLPAARVSDRIVLAQTALGDLDAGAFRAPAFLRSAALYEGIAGRVRLDLSSIDSALLWPHPGDGIGTPFPVRHAGLVCAPTTLPRDGELIALGLSEPAMVDLVSEKAERLWRVGAPAVLLTHPDPGFTDSVDRIRAYAELLRRLVESGRFAPVAPDQCVERLAAYARIDVPAGETAGVA